MRARSAPQAGSAPRLPPRAARRRTATPALPSFGTTRGNTSLLIAANRTVIVAGDAIMSRDHFDNRRVWERSVDPRSAKESFVELREIADVIIPGHDNIMLIG